MSGKVAAYKHFGATLKNEQWSWSAITSGGEVVLSLWRDLLNYRSRPVTYDLFGDPRLSEWIDKPGNKDRIEHLKYARDRREGLFRVVVITAVDTGVEPRRIEEAYPQPNMVMRLEALNEETGEFRAVIVGSPDAPRP